MTEPNESGKKNETAESTEDEPIIELKDEIAVEPGDDEEPIELTGGVEESVAENKDETAEAESDAATAPEETLKGDEEIIDLLQAVEEPAKDEAPIALEEEVADETTADDEIIDLADAAEEISQTEDAKSAAEEMAAPVEDEAIIDLTETADEIALETEDIGELISEDFDTATEFDDISELDSDLIQQATAAADKPDSETMIEDALKDDFADSLGIELDSEKGDQENLFDADKLTSEQVEAALERVIKKMFYEKTFAIESCRNFCWM